MKVLCFLMALLMVFSLTTSLVGQNSPSLQVAVEKISKIKVDLQDVISAVMYNMEVNMFSLYEITEDMGFFERYIVELGNAFLTTFNIISGAVGFVVSMIISLHDLFNIFMGMGEVAIYLLFGMDLSVPKPAT